MRSTRGPSRRPSTGRLQAVAVARPASLGADCDHDRAAAVRGQAQRKPGQGVGALRIEVSRSPPGSSSPPTDARATGASSRGSRARPHCSHAEARTARQCATRRSRRSPSSFTSLRSELTGTIRSTPSSGLRSTVHLLAAGDALDQGDAQRRLVVHRRRVQHLDHGRTLAGLDDARRVVVAVAVEQHAAVALAQAQHAHQVRGGGIRERQARAGASDRSTQARTWRLTWSPRGSRAR